MTVDTGFTQQNLLIARLDFRGAGFQEERLRAVYDELLDRIRHQPGVENAAHVRNVPVGGSFSNRNIVIDGKKQKGDINFNPVSDRYFATMGSALLAGRDFDRRDAATAPKVAIVTEAFARQYFGGQNPVGRTFLMDVSPGAPQPSYEIVGLARDSKYADLRDRFEPLIHVPAAQNDQPISGQRFIVRSRGPLTNISSAVASLARDVHPSIVVSFQTMQSQLEESILRERLMARLSGFFGGLAAVIAMIGLYGVMSYTVARRRNEIGIRMALGADRRQVVRMIMGDAGVLLAIGLGIGTLTSLGAARAARAMLFGVTPHDPATLVGAAGALAAVSALASYLPALRASHLEPTVALRDE
jgi:predicted permease